MLLGSTGFSERVPSHAMARSKRPIVKTVRRNFCLVRLPKSGLEGSFAGFLVSSDTAFRLGAFSQGGKSLLELVGKSGSNGQTAVPQVAV